MKFQSDSSQELMLTNPEILPYQPELPTVPEAFRRSEYEGWLAEKFKRFQLRSFQKTQAQRVEVLRQFNDLQKQCLALARNEADWRHFEQEDRLRQKHLDLKELELTERIDDFLYRREKKLEDRRKAEAAAPPKPRDPVKPPDPVEKFTAELEQALRIQAGLKHAFDRARKQHPDLEEWLDEWEEKVSWDLKEKQCS